MSSSPSKRAFTLIEMLVVIIIIAVMTAVVVPSYTGILASARFDLAVRNVQTIFARAHSRAVSTDTTVTVQYNPATEEFSIQNSIPPPQTDRPTAHLDPSGSTGIDSTIPDEDDRFELNHDSYMASVQNQSIQTGGASRSGSGGTEIQFRGDGTSDAAEIQLGDREGRMVHLILSPANGQLSVADTDSSPGNRP